MESSNTNVFGPMNTSAIITVIIAVFVLLLGATSYYTINPNEQGLVLRFGKYIKTTEPGLHFKIPMGVDRVIKIQTTTIRKAEFGFRTLRSGINSTFNRQGYLVESHMVTGDLNVADVEWIVQYKVSDPYLFSFKVYNIESTIRDISESVMRLFVGDTAVTKVLTTGRSIIAAKAKEKMQEIFNSYQMGIKVTNVILKDVNPPEKVKASFNMVNEAKQEQERMVNEGWKEYNTRLPEAKGKALKVIQSSKGYALERVNQAKGDTKRFLSLYEIFKTAPSITRKRLYLEKMAAIFNKSGTNLFIADPDVKTLVPYLKMTPATIAK